MSRTPLVGLVWSGSVSLALSIAAAGCSVVVPPHIGDEDAFAMHPDAMFPDSGHDVGPPIDVWPAPDRTCASFHIGAFRLIPRVMLIIDQSGSMGTYHFGADTRWVALQNALVGTNGLVTQLNHDAAFGAVMYTDGPDDPACPELAIQAVSFPALATIRGLYDTQMPEGNTPTGESIGYVVDHRAELFDEANTTSMTGPEVIILATDGEPGTCADGADTDTGRMLSVEESTRAFSAGIRTYVVSVGTQVANMHLQDVANAGVGVMPGDPDAPFWVATDTTMLDDALAQISRAAIPCTFELMGHIVPERACEGTVTLGSMPLACGTDWQATDDSHITLSDTACARLQGTTDEISGEFPCDVVVF